MPLGDAARNGETDAKTAGLTAAGACPYTRVCTSVSIARSSEGVRAPPVVSRYNGIGLPPGASAG